MIFLGHNTKFILLKALLRLARLVWHLFSDRINLKRTFLKKTFCIFITKPVIVVKLVEGGLIPGRGSVEGF